MAREETYISQYKPQWEQLENYIKTIDKKGYGNLSAKELKDYLNLMKRVSHHLAYSRTHFTGSPLCQYLNDLSVRAHNHLYVVKKSNLKEFSNYFANGFAKRLKDNKHYIIAAFFIFMFGFILSYILVQNDVQNAGFFLPEEYIQLTDWDLADSEWEEEQFFFLSSYVTINNIGVSIKAFVYSITAGILTTYILFFNGALLGALTSLVTQNSSHILNYWALILPHGIIELSAIFISGGAGLKVGKSLLIPGQYKRKDAFIKSAKEAVMLMPGIILMLIMAGLIEGFLTPARLPMLYKLIFAGITAIAMLLYIIIPRKEA
ncbi:MAG: hypothetical protein CVU84_14875 [Firmicutes bacterium HGW-Firmicutes-1]|jgi:uncharacterized membrane protein SpoIIM required for sporulation|nr:MAG: hypothetical protein CVU84_14875 [Firmicutes bacterium HGW-Firmicutes-1]